MFSAQIRARSAYLPISSMPSFAVLERLTLSLNIDAVEMLGTFNALGNEKKRHLLRELGAIRGKGSLTHNCLEIVLIEVNCVDESLALSLYSSRLAG